MKNVIAFLGIVLIACCIAACSKSTSTAASAETTKKESQIKSASGKLKNMEVETQHEELRALDPVSGPDTMLLREVR